MGTGASVGMSQGHSGEMPPPGLLVGSPVAVLGLLGSLMVSAEGTLVYIRVSHTVP